MKRSAILCRPLITNPLRAMRQISAEITGNSWREVPSIGENRQFLSEKHKTKSASQL
jgi:hypothetical protein